MARDRAAGIVIYNNKLLVMYRNKNNKEYYTFPGGGIEPGETLEQAVAREINEETSVNISVDKLAYEFRVSNGDVHYYYLCTYIDGEPKLKIGSNEYKDNLLGQNIYKPQWMPLDKIPDTILYPTEAKDAVINNLRNGFPQDTLIINMQQYN